MWITLYYIHHGLYTNIYSYENVMPLLCWHVDDCDCKWEYKFIILWRLIFERQLHFLKTAKFSTSQMFRQSCWHFDTTWQSTVTLERSRAWFVTYSIPQGSIWNVNNYMYSLIYFDFEKEKPFEEYLFSNST